MAEMLRIAAGPKREPERKELAVSNGAPAIAKSRPSAESSLGILMKVPILQKRGDDNALAGCLTFIVKILLTYTHVLALANDLIVVYNLIKG